MSHFGHRFDCSVKTIIVGDSGVGKTSISFRFIKNFFKHTAPATLGVEFMSKIIATKSRRIEFQLWDTAGQELFRSVTRAYYRGAIGAFIVFDLTQRATFMDLRRWIADVQATALPEVVTILLGNKSDLTAAREVSREEAEQLAAEKKIMYFETSAFTGDNVEDAMLACLAEVEVLMDSGRYQTSEAMPILEQPGEEKRTRCC
jgi:small GTP-binding protein